jgi:hypothetical protein
MKQTKKEMLSSCNREVSNAKIIANNTLQIYYADGTEAIRLHETDIVTLPVDKKTIMLDSGGWRTRTTKERINDFLHSKNIGRIYQHKGVWYINNSLFYDEMVLNTNGKIVSGVKTINTKKIDSLKKKISKFVNQLSETNLPLPNGGDCWVCNILPDNGDNGHLLAHIRENYLHGSLVVSAMRFAGYSDMQIGVHY